MSDANFSDVLKAIHQLGGKVEGVRAEVAEVRAAQQLLAEAVHQNNARIARLEARLDGLDPQPGAPTGATPADAMERVDAEGGGAKGRLRLSRSPSRQPAR